MKGRQIAEVRIDPRVVEGVVLVVRGRLEDRVQVERSDAQAGQVVEAIDDALQVAAHEVVKVRGCAPGLHILRVVRRVAVGEAIRKNLIEDGVPNPLRGDEGRSLVGIAASRAFYTGVRRDYTTTTTDHLPPTTASRSFDGLPPIAAGRQLSVVGRR